MESDPLDSIVRELLLERTDSLDPPQLAAFVDGWGSALRLLDHADTVMPGAPPPLLEALDAVLRRIRAAQARVLDDGEL